MKKIERARKFYHLLKGKVQELNSEGLNLTLQPGLAKDGIKIHLVGETTIDSLIEMPENPKDPLVLIKGDQRYLYYDDDLVVEMIFAADQGCHFKKYLPEGWVANLFNPLNLVIPT